MSHKKAGYEDKHPGLLDVHLSLDRSQVKQMFTYDVDSWFEILFAIKGRTCPWRPWLLVMTITFIFLILHPKYWGESLGLGECNADKTECTGFDKDVNPVVHSTFGIVLGFLIVYQSSQSSARWWEGRVCWENIITHSRESMRILCAHCNGREIIKLFGKYIIAFSVTSKHYLSTTDFSKENPCPELEKILQPNDLERLYRVAPRHRPLACLYACQRITEIAIRKGLFSRPVARDINPRFITLADQLGACERILYTPMPWVYTLHLRFVLLVFLVFTPLGMFGEDPLPVATQVIIFMAILSYAFLGLEDMAVKIQNPFGNNPSDLPLEIFTFVAYRDVKDIINMKYQSFDKSYTDKLYALGQYEIEWKKKHVVHEEDDDADDGDD